MAMLTPNQLVKLLEACSTEPVCPESCPLREAHPKCVRTLMQQAAAMISAQCDVTAIQAAKLEALRKLADEYFSKQSG